MTPRLLSTRETKKYDKLLSNVAFNCNLRHYTKDVAEGIAICKEAHRSGKAGDTLREWIALSQQLYAQETG